MKCLKCGYCCHQLTVPIVDVKKKGIAEANMIVKIRGQRCPHLKGDGPGEFTCALHGEKWYKDTPCAGHGRDNVLPDDTCALGAYIMECVKALSQVDTTKPA